MTVRAVDLQTMIPRTGEVGRLQQQAEQQPQLAQHVSTALGQARVERAQSQVNAKAPSDSATLVRRDGGGQGGGGQSRPRKDGKAGAAKEQHPQEPGLGQRLDVKV